MGKSRLNQTVWMFIVVVLPIIVVVKLLIPPRPFVNTHLTAGAYVWPEGCSPRQYKKYDSINIKCEDKNYYMGDMRSNGFPQRSKGFSEYYRVGFDSIDIACGGLFKSDDDCEVINIATRYFSK